MKRQTWGWMSLGACVFALAACGGETPPARNPLTPEVGSPPPSYPVGGWVQDTVGRPIAGARIEVVTGESASVVFTREDGRFSLDRTFTYPPILRASKDGFLDALGLNVRYADRIETRFRLVSTTPPVDLSGRYLLTFAADPTCTSLPEEVRTRTYTVGFPPFSPWPSPVMLGGAAFEPPGPGQSGNFYNLMYVSVSESFVRLTFDDPEIIERLGDGATVSLWGHAEGTITGPVSEIPMSGAFAFCAERKADGTGCEAEVSCPSEAHTLTLTRQ